MEVVFNETHPTIVRATQMANELLRSERFYEAIAAKDRFALSTASPAIIADLMRRSPLIFKLELFYPNVFQTFLKYRKTLAFTDGRHPNTLFLNVKKLGRSTESIVATIIHETVHALDDDCKEYTFGHGNNSPAGKQDTAPYWIGNLAYRLLTNEPNAPALVFDTEEAQEDEEIDELV